MNRTRDSAPDERSAVHPSDRRRDELPPLAGIEDDLGEGALWGMTVGLSQVGVRTQIALQHLGLSPGGREAAPMVWDALCRLERMLQERRDARAAGGPRSHAELLGAE
jgi:hypothetical protein